MTVDKTKRIADVWLAVWGIGVAFLMQVLYDGFGLVLGKALQFYVGLAVAAIFLIGLAIVAVHYFNKKQ